TIRSNWIGESATGAPFPNPFGVVFQANAVNNTATGNAFGPNTYANYFVADPSATGNVIDATSPPTTPPPPPTSPPPPPAWGTGPGTPARFTVMSGKDGTTMLVGATDPFGGDFTGGAFVAAGDLNGDGRAEFVFTPDQGGGPNTVIYSLNADGSLAAPKAFFA